MILKDVLTGKQITSHIPLTQQLGNADFYDLIIIAVRLEQLDAVIQTVKQNTVCPLIMLVLNDPNNMMHLANELPQGIYLISYSTNGGLKFPMKFVKM